MAALVEVAEGWSEMKTAALMLCYNQTPEQLELTTDALASVLYWSGNRKV